MKTKPLVTVKQGACHVNSIALVHAGPGFMHLRGDMRAKYAEVHMTSGTGFWIEATERTLHLEPKEKWEEEHGHTCVEVHPRGGKRWTIEAHIARYTLEIFVYTEKRGRQAWMDEDGT